MQQRQVRLRKFTFPRYWEEIVETVTSTAWLLQRLASIESEFRSTNGAYISVFLDDTLGDSLHVGLTGESWTITHIKNLGEYDSEFQYAIGDPSAHGHIPILAPEWTDISMKRLVVRPTAEKIVAEWVEKGTLYQGVKWTYNMP